MFTQIKSRLLSGQIPVKIITHAVFRQAVLDSVRISGKLPNKTFWVHPPDSAMKSSTVVGDWHLRSIFIWLPDMVFKKYIPHGVPCPRCKTATAVKKKGWISHKCRRGITRNRCIELATYFYECRLCKADKAKLDDDEVR